MNLQVGDKIICKKKNRHLTEYKSYVISSKSIISSDVDIIYYILDDNNQSDWFSTNKGYFFIYDYFYTPEELILLRLLKLESL